MKHAKIRISETVWSALEPLLLAGYPDEERGVFLNCGWTVGEETISVVIKEILIPKKGDVVGGVDIITFNESYLVSSAMKMEKSKFAIGVVHSHPLGYSTFPSKVDDEMDEYLSKYFTSFSADKPYVSFIISRSEEGSLRFSGRIFLRGEWILCSQIQVVGAASTVTIADNFQPPKLPKETEMRLQRMVGVLGLASAEKLWRSQVCIIGVGGTGSALFHSLVRSCVGRIIIIDPDVLSISNSERLHGFNVVDLKGPPMLKVEIMKRMANQINPDIEIITLAMSAQSETAKKYIADSDFIFGCTDSQVGKVLLSDLSLRYLLPSIQVNVAMETKEEVLTGEIVHLVKYGPDLPCVYCYGFVNAQKLSQELMSDEEREQRKTAQVGFPAGTYWLDEPILHTVGSLTTFAAELAANYGVGLITETYKPPANFVELDLLQLHQPVTTMTIKPSEKCLCFGHAGCGSQVDSWL